MTLPPDVQEQFDDAIERMAAEHTAAAVSAMLVEIRNGDSTASARLFRIANYARRKFVAQIEGLLDDPSFLTHPEDYNEGYLDELEAVARALGLDLQLIIDSKGTQFERDRLKDTIARIRPKA